MREAIKHGERQQTKQEKEKRESSNIYIYFYTYGWMQEILFRPTGENRHTNLVRNMRVTKRQPPTTEDT